MCFQLDFNWLEMGQFWHDLLFIYLCHLSYLCSFNNNTMQTLFLCNLNAVCIWLDTKCDEWGCVWVTEWMNGLATVFLCDKCDVWMVVWMVWKIVWLGFISGEYFQPFGMNVRDEWLCDWDLFQYIKPFD